MPRPLQELVLNAKLVGRHGLQDPDWIVNVVSNALLGKQQMEQFAPLVLSVKHLMLVESASNVLLEPTVMLQVSKPVSNVTPERALKRDQSR